MLEKLRNRPFAANFLVALALIALILLFVAPALSPDKMLAPLDIITESWPPWQEPNQTVTVHNFMLIDVVNYIIPVKRFMANAIRAGELPLWNPYVFTGYPFTYNTQAGMWYPLSLLYYLLPLPTAVDATVIGQMILGGLFMLAYLRQIRLSHLAALGGAIIYTFNGFMIVWLEWQVVHAAVIWLPLQLWLVEKITSQLEQTTGASKKVLMLSIFSGILFAVPWLGGHWNWTLFTSMMVAIYLLWRLFPLFKQSQDKQQRQLIFLSVILSLGIGTAVALIQVLPAFNYLGHTHRQPITFAESLTFSLWDRLVVMVIPNFFGTPVQSNWWGTENYNETTFYLGLMPVLLAGLAIWLRRDRWTIFFSIWGLLGLLWAVRTPLYYLLHALPVFNGLFPSRTIFFTVVSVSVLAALSIDHLQKVENLPNRKQLLQYSTFLVMLLVALCGTYFWVYRAEVQQTWAYLRPQTVTAAALLLIAFALLGARLNNWLTPRLFVPLTLLFIVLDLFYFGHDYNTIASLDNWFSDTAVANFLHAEPTPYRIATPAENIVYIPNTSLIDAIPNVSGYEPGVWQNTTRYLQLAEGEDSIRFGRFLMPLTGLNSPLLDAINTRYIVTTKNIWGSQPAEGPAQKSTDIWHTLAPNEPIQHPLAMPDAGLHRLDLWLRPVAASSGQLIVRIFTADGVLELANSSLDVNQIAPEAENAFYFEALPSEWGRSFLFQITFQGEGEVQLGTNAAGDPAFSTYYLPRPNLAFEDGKSQIYRNPDAFERAYFVPQAIVAHSKEAAETAVLNHATELDKLVILEPTGNQVPTQLGAAASVSSDVTITNYGLNRIEIATNSDIPGFLLLADTYYPGWRATVDGQDTPVYLANTLVRAVALPAGSHTVVFSFWPPDFIGAAIISGLTLLGSLIALIVLWRRGTQKQSSSR